MPAPTSLVRLLLVLVCAWLPLPLTRAAEKVDWSTMDTILARIQAPTFPARDFSITDHGAPVDGVGDSTKAIAAAIRACHDAGGGRVVVPAGTFRTGAIHLLSNVNLHVSPGATLLFSTDPKDYLPLVRVRFEGTECFNYSPLIYANGQKNIAVTGQGTLDGGATWDNWWSYVRRDLPAVMALQGTKELIEMGEKGVPVEERRFGAAGRLRPNFIVPYACENVLIEGIRIVRSPMWNINPVLCRNVTVRGVDISTQGPNNDGCNPDSSRDVLIEDCRFDTGDDCIAIKSGKDADGRRVGVPTENVIIRRCQMAEGHGGVVIGSEVAGSVRNVFAEHCTMDSPVLDRALRLKTNAGRGGVIENIFFRDVTVGRVAHSLLTIDLIYGRVYKGDYPPVVRNVVMERVTSKSSPRVLWVMGPDQCTIENVEVKDCVFNGVEGEDEVNKPGTVTLTRVQVNRVAKP